MHSFTDVSIIFTTPAFNIFQDPTLRMLSLHVHQVLAYLDPKDLPDSFQPAFLPVGLLVGSSFQNNICLPITRVPQHKRYPGVDDAVLSHHVVDSL